MLARRRVGRRAARVRHARAVAERPDARHARDAQDSSTSTRPRSSSGSAELAQQRVRAHARRPDERLRRDARAVAEHGLVGRHRLERRADVDLDAALRRARAPRTRRAAAGSPAGSSAPRRRAPSAAARRAAAGSSASRRRRGRRARRAPRRPRSPRRRRRTSSCARRAPSSSAASAASSRRSTWLRRSIASGSDLNESACSARPGIGSVRGTAPSASTSSRQRTSCGPARSRPSPFAPRGRRAVESPSSSSACGHITRSGTTRVPRLERPRRRLGQERRVEHEVLVR